MLSHPWGIQWGFKDQWCEDVWLYFIDDTLDSSGKFPNFAF